MKQYLDFLKLVRVQGSIKTDRTGIGTVSVFGHQMRFTLNDGFPLVPLSVSIFRQSSMNCCGF